MTESSKRCFIWHREPADGESRPMAVAENTFLSCPSESFLQVGRAVSQALHCKGMSVPDKAVVCEATAN